jgi:DNA-binding winged helix-turn-helix (wHTH) protein/pimeloyl-ACP methyl ester carboxylesterase
MVLVVDCADGAVEVDEQLFEVRRDGDPVPLEPQAFDVLLYLVRHRDRVVPKEELMDSVWGGRFVSETAVTSRIKQIRRALGDDGQSQRVIRTLHGRGYRFVAPIEQAAPSESGAETSTNTAHPPPAQRTQADEPPLPTGATAPVRYTQVDDLHIAYQVTGGGDLDIVLISGFVSHLDLDWGDPRHAHFLDRLGSMGRLIRFDKRGTGMSDRPPGVPDLETRMHDVLAVMDAVGSERAVLWGYSEGGPMAVMMAAMHPERVHSLVLYGCYARRVWAPDYPWALTAKQRAVYTDHLVRTWDWASDLLYRCPSGDAAMQEWWTHRMRASATPATVRALMDMNALVDVRALLPSLAVPTLVVHRRGDQLSTLEEARWMAGQIPGAEMVELEGDDHFVAGDPDQILDAIEPFVRSTPTPVHRMALAAVVHVAGVEAERVVEQLVAAGGRLRHAAGGEVVVLFDGPATAVRAAHAALEDDYASAGLSIAEVAVDGGPVSGQGVDEAIRLGSGAGAGQLAVTATAGVLMSSVEVLLEPTDAAGVEGALRVHGLST